MGFTYFATSSVFSAPFLTPWPTALVPFFTPFPVSLAAVLVASPVLSAAFSVALPVSLAAVPVASPVFTAAFLVACPVVTAAFLVALPVSSAAFFTSVPAWPYENAVRASSAAAIINENLVLIFPPGELQRSLIAKFFKSMKHARTYGKGMAQCCPGSVGRFGSLVLEFGESFFVHVPFLQDREDGF